MYNKEHAEHLMEQFADRISGGAFAYKDSKNHELLFANHNVVQLFECNDYEDLFSYVKESFEGMIADSSREEVLSWIRAFVPSLLPLPSFPSAVLAPSSLWDPEEDC